MRFPPVISYSRSERGHRRSLIELMQREIGAERRRAASLWFAPQPVLFLMIEEHFGFFFALACLRAAFGRRTVGFCLRPKPVLKPSSPRLHLKRFLLQRLRRLAAVRVLTFIPFYAQPGFETIAHGWIYDPQLWDLTAADRELVTYSKPLRRSAKPRIIAAGVQSRDKGFDQFARLATQSAKDLDFLAAGPVKPEVGEAVTELAAAGGTVVDRELSDRELLLSYSGADLVWGHFAPSYDQASGIAGRAIQLGIPVVVRRRSLMEAICRQEGVRHLTLEQLKAGGTPPQRFDGALLADRFRRISLATLRAALGLEAETGT